MRTRRSLCPVRPPGALWRAIPWRAVAGACLSAIAVAAQAGPGAVPSTDLLGLPKTVPVYYANSPSGVHTVLDPATGASNAASNSGTPLRKFVDPLPGIDPVSNCGPGAWALVAPSTPSAANGGAGSPTAPTGKGVTQSCIPLAIPDTTTYPGTDYYVIGVVEYAQQMHSDLPKTTALRGYTQLNHPTYAATQATVPDPQNPATRTITTYTAWPQPHYLGPVIVATRDRPVRVKYVNLLPTGRAVFATGGQPACEVITVSASSGASSLSYYNGTSTSAPPAKGNMDNTFATYSSPGSQLDAGIPEVGATTPPTYVTGNFPFCEAIANAPVATARNGDLMIPNDLTIRGGGFGTNQNGDSDCSSELGAAAGMNLLDVLQAADAYAAGMPVQAGQPAYTKKYPGTTCLHTLNRTELHLHGGMSPWISDGTPHQWVVPQLEASAAAYPQSGGAIKGLGRYGESYVNVPDMPDPGPGAGTLFWTNQQSSRLMFYHDHTSGMTRTNVYVGEAAGYVLRDPIEATLESGGSITPPAASGLASVTVPAGAIPTVGIPLVIEDKTFVPADIAAQDPLWSTTWWGVPGDLWYPHVYETNQDPFSITGSNNAGRWDYGQWFFPPMNPSTLRGPIPQPSLTPEGFMDTPVINGTAYPVLHVNPGLTRFRILNVPNERNNNLSWFLADTAQATGITGTSGLSEVKMMAAVPPSPLPASPVAGTVYSCPTTGNNLDQTLFGGQPMPVIDSATGLPLLGTGLPRQGYTYTLGDQSQLTATGVGTTSAANGSNHILIATGADAGACWPASWPTDGRDGGVPDPTNAGPAWIQIGTEGGFLPQAQIIPPTPLGYEYNRRSVTVLNSYYHGLFIGPAERVDVLVDFSQFAGKTLILYNDAPAPNPGFDARNDYYTGDVDQTASGGSQTTLAGFGPNTRTIMQVIVDGVGAPVGSTATALSGAALAGLANQYLPAAFAASQPAPVVGEPGWSPAYPVAATATATAEKAALGAAGAALPANAFIQQYGKIGDHTVTFYSGTQPATATTLAGLNKFTAYEAGSSAGGGAGGSPIPPPAGDNLLGSAAIHEIFDTDYGRMNSVEGYELPATNFLTQTTVPLAYVDPTTDMFKEGETQVWKITHNGVDTHTIHFHLLNLQVVNRVGWDGTIRPPDPDEVGWKESIKMNPLEDIYVAFQAVKPYLPFNLPDSNRRPDPTQPTASIANFTNPPGGEFPYIPPMNCSQGPATTPAFAPLQPAAVAATPACQNAGGLGVSGLVTATSQGNTTENYGWEYVWHCHLLGHEENDMMRPLVLSVQSVLPPAATIGTATSQAANTTAVPPTPAGLAVTWTDPTPVAYTATPAWPYLTPLAAATGIIPVSTTANLGNAANEIGFAVYRYDFCVAGNATTPMSCPATAPTSAPAYPGAGWNYVGNGLANSTSFVDTSAYTGGYFAYAVVTYNQAGPAAAALTGVVQMTAANGPPTAPTTLVATPNAATAPTPSTVTLAWVNTATNATNTVVQRCTAASPTATCAPVDLTTLGVLTGWVDTGVVPNTTYCYAVFATNTSGASAASNVACATTPALPPVAPASIAATFTPMPTNTSPTAPFALAVKWVNAAANTNSGFVTQVCVGACSAATGTWVNTTAQPAGLATAIADSQGQGALVSYRVAATAALTSCVNGVCAAPVTAQSAWTYSAAVQLAVIPAAPAAPIATASTTGAPAVALAWTNPVPAPNAAPANVIVNRAVPPTAAATVLATLAAGASSYSDAAVAAGTSYAYSITEQNAAGQATSPSTTVTTSIVVAAPTNLAVRGGTTVTYNSVWLQFTNNATNQTGFPVYRALATAGVCPAVPAGMTTTTASGGWQFLNTVTGTGFGGGSTVTYHDTTVGPGTNYCYVVQAINATAYSLPSNVLSVATPAITVSAPAALAARLAAGATAGATPSVTLNWAFNRGAGTVAPTRFDIMRNNGTTFVTIGTVSAAGCGGGGGGGGGCNATFTDAAPLLAATDSYQVVAVNVTGGVQTFSLPSNTASVNVVALPATPALTAAANAVGTRTVNLTWNAPTAGTATQVQIQRATNATFTAGLNTANSTITATTYTTQRLAAGTTYYFRIVVRNASGFVYSNTASATAR